MKQSEQINELATALAKAKATMKMPEKDCNNPFFKSKYASLESIGKATQPSLSANGLSIVQCPDYEEGKMILVTMLIHSSGQWLKATAPLLPVKNDSQGLGGAMSYMKRYCWPAIIGLAGVDEDDDGTADREALNKKEAEEEKKAEVISKQQIAKLEQMFALDPEHGKNVKQALLAQHGISDLKDVPVDIYKSICEKAKARKKNMAPKVEPINMQMPEVMELGF